MTTPHELSGIIHRCPRCGSALPAPGADGSAGCGDCGASFLPAVPGVPSLLARQADSPWFEHYTESLGQFEDEGRQLCYTSQRAHQIIMSMWDAALAEVPAGGRLLDVGCGQGGLSSRYLDRWQVVGVDFVAQMLPQAKRAGLTVYNADATSLPFADDQFDIVICGEVLQHFDDVSTVMRELTRVCRPGGVVAVSTHNRKSLLRRTARILRRLQLTLGLGGKELWQSAVARTPRQIIDSVTHRSISAEAVFWSHFPFRLIRHTGLVNVLAPLATNFLLRLRKQS